MNTKRSRIYSFLLKLWRNIKKTIFWDIWLEYWEPILTCRNSLYTLNAILNILNWIFFGFGTFILQKKSWYISESLNIIGKRKRFDYGRNFNAHQKLESAIAAVLDGKLSQRQASRMFGVPQTTISMRMKQRGLIQPVQIDLLPLWMWSSKFCLVWDSIVVLVISFTWLLDKQECVS